MSEGRYRALDAFRGICAVLVMLFHLDAATHFYGWPLVRNGYMAVAFFFVLSGFVIAGAYERSLSTGKGLLRFALRRFGRLYPLHAAVLFIYVAIEGVALVHGEQAFTGNFSLASLACSFLLIQGFGSYHEAWNYPAWSISVELWANLAFGLYVAMLGRRSVLASVAVLILSALYLELGGGLTGPLDESTRDALADVALSVFGFALGTLAFAVRGRIAASSFRPGAATEVVALALAIGVFWFGDSVPGLLATVVFGVVVLVFSFDGGPVSRVLHRTLLQRLGAISYSVYLTHSLYLFALGIVVEAVGHLLGLPATIPHGDDSLLTLGGPFAMDLAAALTVLATLWGSTQTHRLIEEPARRFFGALSNGERIPVAWGVAFGSRPTTGDAAPALMPLFTRRLP
jgi:peptidoglycan/LPS O-acetylase OafA/YrhL